MYDTTNSLGVLPQKGSQWQEIWEGRHYGLMIKFCETGAEERTWLVWGYPVPSPSRTTPVATPLKQPHALSKLYEIQSNSITAKENFQRVIILDHCPGLKNFKS